jgi:CRP-like cAMP-binding protein
MAKRAREVDNLKIIEKIPIFRGLSLGQVKRLLDAGETRKFGIGQTLCRQEDKSTDLFILMVGEVAVQVSRSEMARITPVEVIGEMGVITTQPRSATVEATKACTAIVISKIHFDQILKSDHELAAKLYKNVIEAMGRRLRNANEITSTLI